MRLVFNSKDNGLDRWRGPFLEVNLLSVTCLSKPYVIFFVSVFVFVYYSEEER